MVRVFVRVPEFPKVESELLFQLGERGNASKLLRTLINSLEQYVLHGNDDPTIHWRDGGFDIAAIRRACFTNNSVGCQTAMLEIPDNDMQPRCRRLGTSPRFYSETTELLEFEEAFSVRTLSNMLVTLPESFHCLTFEKRFLW